MFTDNILPHLHSKVMFILTFIGILFSLGCQFGKKPERVLNKENSLCFQAIDGNDTAYMELDTSTYEIIGKMRFFYADSNQYVGDFKGEIKGDTLTGFYDFQSNSSEKWHRNPVSFLKQGSEWIMGDGKFVLIWGSGYFDPKVPINYSQAKFKFKAIPCP
ncbi:MAG: hypothetical protein EOO99_10055 [Pedobacter sp.]|nr:MAG: hypothetical protein EOO99_10055 [Pedobacter sp.]